MMKKVTLATLLIAALTACSSGGGSSNPVKKPDEQTPPKCEGICSNGGNGNDEGQQTKTLYSGAYFSTAATPKRTGDINALLETSEADQIVLDGKAITLNQKGLDWQGTKALKYSRFGAYVDRSMKDRDGDPANYLFSFGQITPEKNMPKGTVTYVGSAIYGSEVINGYTTADANFSVNFDAKTLSGTISNPSKGIVLKTPVAQIAGSSFTGKTEWTGGRGKRTGAEMNGHFYGPNAEEMGGVINFENNGKGGAVSFGATKQ